MKTIPRLASMLLPLAVLASAPVLRAEETDQPTDAPFKPKEFDLSRYARNFEKKSPFEFDPPPPPPAEQKNSFEGVSLGGYCGNGNTLTVYLIVGKEKKRITVYGDASPYKKLDKSGFRVIRINRGASLSSTSVVLEKDGQEGEVEFDKETLTAKGTGAGGTQIIMGPDGKPIQRPAIPRPGGMAGGPPQPYQAPAPFIVGQGNNPAMQNTGVNPNGGIPVPGQPQNNLNFQTPGQPLSPQQQQVNQLLNGTNVPAVPNVVNPVPGQPNGASPVGSRRRVVLPTQGP